MQESSTEAVNEAENKAETVVNEQKEQTLEERLALATEKKPEPERINIDTSFFGSDEPAAGETASSEIVKEGAKEPTKPATQITDKAKRSSASVAVGMLDMTFQTILTPLHGWKFKRKFKAEEVKKLDEYVADSTIEELEEEDKKLKRKWDRLLKSYTSKKEAIPLDEKEKRDLENAFYQYFDFKEKTLPPEWFVYMAVINSVGKRTIDLITE